MKVNTSQIESRRPLMPEFTTKAWGRKRACRRFSTYVRQSLERAPMLPTCIGASAICTSRIRPGNRPRNVSMRFRPDSKKADQGKIFQNLATVLR